MQETLLILLTGINVIIAVFLFLLYKNSGLNAIQRLEEKLTKIYSDNAGKTEGLIKDEFGRNRDETSRNAKAQREEVSNSFKLFGDQLFNRITDIANMQKSQLDIFAGQLSKLIQSNEEKFDKLHDKVEENLKEIQESNSKKLDEMRQTVDEKLHTTLEKRLGESFKLVSERLELVHKGLGEMQTLASGVGDLKRVLANVKARGTWGEIQLGSLIEQILAPDQYAQNVSTKKGSGETVEFAIKLPGRNELKDEIVWLPIDAKFPLKAYQDLMDAQDMINPSLIEERAKILENQIKLEAKEICKKYIDPPQTTDFGIMFLPIEGLYAEVLRRTGLAELIQREFRVILAGPTNIAALLNSLQMGFRTLAIEKRSSEVWKLLGVVKSEFTKFGDILEKTQIKLDQASKSIGDATKKTRTIERKLRDVQELPQEEKIKLLEDLEE